MSDVDPAASRPPYRISPVRKAKGAIAGSILVGYVSVSAIVPNLHLRLGEWLSVGERAAFWITLGVYAAIGLVVSLAIWSVWRRLERWRTGRRTWHRRPSRPAATTPSPPNGS